MEESTSKEKVLKNIRNALINVADNPFPQVDFNAPIYHEMEDALDLSFAKAFTETGGKFLYCASENEFAYNFKLLSEQKAWPDVFCQEEHITALLTDAKVSVIQGEEAFTSMKVGLSTCEYLIARLGSIMVSSKNASGRRINTFPEIHVVVAYTHQLVPDLKQAFSHLSNKYAKKMPSMVSIITGPSRTADIEKTLVLGAHGPKELYLFLIDTIQE